MSNAIVMNYFDEEGKTRAFIAEGNIIGYRCPEPLLVAAYADNVTRVVPISRLIDITITNKTPSKKKADAP